MDFKENRNGEAMNHKQLKKKWKEFINNPNFAYSLYYYLSNDHQINKNFTPVRYYGEGVHTYRMKEELNKLIEKLNGNDEEIEEAEIIEENDVEI